ncbi:hypothetical protein [Hymenobacter ruricola]|uniref:PH domain-containing protein n=1 Tax=Hymenobacter ruricola TaxID=2791023 RepID=A0ABS0IAE6_9BACT|nr:hypothetical protein [Hymenobacter ruricola]MBF9223936.1 hypothetical protein [Hymenobacter ruricola]
MPFTRLSSRLTLLYKLIIPLVGVAGLTCYVWVILSQHWLLELHGVLALSLFTILLLFTVTVSIRIRHVAYNDSFIQVRNYGQPILIPNTEYRMLELGEFPFSFLYRLRTSNANPQFLGSFSEALKLVVNNSFEPENIAVARRVLSRNRLN